MSLYENSQGSTRKRKILVIEDSEINREILIELLSPEYEIVTAENGESGLSLLKKHRKEFSLVLLDVYMPVMSGFEFLKITQQDPYLASVPVIVTTGSDSREDEEECIRLGATDYITKPYNAEVMFSRIHNIIRYRETLRTLSVVEYDYLTGLYNMSAFYHHAGQILQDDSDSYDLVSLEILDSDAIKNIYGTKKSSEVLTFFADEMQKHLPDNIMARQRNYFYVLLKAEDRMDLKEDLDILNRLSSNGPVPNIRLRVCLYLNVDKTQPVSVLCDRAKSGVKSSVSEGTITVSYYDADMEQKRVNGQRMLLDFRQALTAGEFIFYLQPKTDLMSGQITAAEALVRWRRRDGEFISPGKFIPLLERENLIPELDEYIFRSVCRYQKHKKEAGARRIPISVNLSRNSLFSEGIIGRYQAIAEKYGVDLSLVPLEITESAAQASVRVESICNAFVNAGFILHMDDFGTGYSSLSSLATLPFSILKLDKTLVDRIGTNKGNTIIKYITETAQELGMKTVAEGVEQKEQAEYLMSIETDMIQGYYYSAPVPTERFDEMMEEKEPFRGKLFGVSRQDFLKLGGGELKRYLRMLRTLFTCVRVVDSTDCSYSTADENGELTAAPAPCFAIWKREERCANCITQRALETQRTCYKFEVLEGKVFLVFASYIEADGKPMVVEMMNEMQDTPGADNQ